MTGSIIDYPGLLRTVVTRFLMGLILIPAIFFVTAGTINYWQAWVYSLIIFIPLTFVMFYLIKNSPELLERRMRTREKEKKQNLIIKFSAILYILVFFLPGIDIRYGWSEVPFGVVIFADMIVLGGYLFIFRVFRENQYASRVVEVDEKQKVINTGPYSLVRHPMYIGMLAMYLLTPLALGSYWALIPAIFIVPTIVWRLTNEEKVLLRDLPGYKHYIEEVKFRLLPWIW